MNELQNVFNYGGNEVRTIVKGEEVWFVAKDVCDVLEISNSRDALNRLDNDEKAMSVLPTQFGNKEMNLVNESGLYSLILTSRKSEAKQFKRWVTHEVLPTIRKHGAYMTENTIEKALTSPDFLIQLATQLKDEQQKRANAEKTIEAQKPKVVFAEAIEVSKNSILVKDLSTLLKQKGIDIGQNRLFEWLREHDFLCKKKGEMYNKPTQRSLEMKLFEVKTNIRTASDGELKTTYTPKVTGKGQIYFVNKFLGEAQ